MFFLCSPLVLSFRLKKQTSKNVAGTTFNNFSETIFSGKLKSKCAINQFVMSVNVVHNFLVAIFDTIDSVKGSPK